MIETGEKRKLLIKNGELPHWCVEKPICISVTTRRGNSLCKNRRLEWVILSAPSETDILLVHEDTENTIDLKNQCHTPQIHAKSQANFCSIFGLLKRLHPQCGGFLPCLALYVSVACLPRLSVRIFSVMPYCAASLTPGQFGPDMHS